ncbi:hypothetical protein HK105_203297 [Polyrhizophydium stewartii]|uniref:Ankyrin repeat protein n=1 Tax=Polyrhizophydium stewartii TaxID=2732419 RepID=A0ABR4NCJ6_9FUNG
MHASIAEKLSAIQACVDGLVAAIAVPGAASAGLSEQVHALGALAQGVRELVGTPHAAKRPRVDDGKEGEAGGGEAQGGGIDDHAGERGTEEPPAKRQRSIRSHWDRLPAELHAMVLARASPVTKLINGITVDVARLPRSEQRALWLDVFDLDWRPADPSVFKPNEMLGSCTDKDLWRIRSREMCRFVWSLEPHRPNIRQVALRNDWLDHVGDPDHLTPVLVGGAGLTLAQLRSAVDRFQIKITSEMAIACAESCGVDVMQWLHTEMRKGGWRKAVMDTVAQAGNLEVVEWLHKNVATGCTKDAMDGAAGNGHLRVVQFLHKRRKEGCTTDAMDRAAANGHLDVVEFLHNNRREGCSAAAMDNAAANGHLDVVEFLHNNRTEGCTTNAMDAAATNGHLDVVEFLHNNRAEGCTETAMDGAATNGHLRVVKFLHNNRTEGCSVAAIDRAASNGHLHVVRWLHANRAEGCTKAAMDGAAGNGHLRVVDFLHNNRAEGCTILSLNRAAANGHLAVVRFLLCHRADECVTRSLDDNQPAFVTGADGRSIANENRANFGINKALINGHAEIARLLLSQGNITPTFNAVLQAIHNDWPEIFNMVIEFGLHSRLKAEDLVFEVKNDSRLRIVCEHSSDKWRGEMMQVLTRQGDLEWMRKLYKLWPIAIDAVTLDDVRAGIGCEAPVKSMLRFNNNELLDFVLAHKPALFDNQNVASLLTSLARNLHCPRIPWISRNFPDVYAAHPASKIDGQPADAVINALARSGVTEPFRALEQAIRRNDVATVKWLRGNSVEYRFKKRADQYLRGR